MDVSWWWSQLTPLRPGFWLAASFLLSGLTLVTVRTAAPEYEGRLRRARWILVPYVGLLVGGLSPRRMGLSEIDWGRGLGLGLGLTFAVVVLLALIRLTLEPEPVALSGEKARSRSISLGERILYAGAQEFHWAFLRGAVWETLLNLPSPPELAPYWAIWMASVLALPGISVQYARTSQRLIAAVVLTTTAILFLYTYNFWLCWLLHASAQLILDQRPTSLHEA